MHGISFVEVLCVTEATPNAQRACTLWDKPGVKYTAAV